VHRSRWQGGGRGEDPEDLRRFCAEQSWQDACHRRRGPIQSDHPAGAAELIIYSERWAPRRVSVPSLAGDLGEIRLEAGTELVGRLIAADGRVYARKVVALESTDGGQLNWVPIRLAYKTDREGLFRVPALKGSYKIWVARGAESGPDECAPIHSDGPPPAVLPRVVDFHPDSQGANPRLGLTLQASPEVAIRGTVTGWDGKPAQGVAMILQAAIGKEMGNPYAPLAWAYTDARGRYALTGIPRGLSQSYLMLLPHAPPSNQAFRAIPSGHFHMRPNFHNSQGVNFEPLTEDQDPLDFRFQIEAP
jgi:hypothetical protein